MYVPQFNEENNISVLHAHIRSKPFGAWTTIAKGEIVINHIPFVLREGQGELGTLVGHVARSNKIFEEFSATAESVVVFQGDQAYISPSWYASKQQHGKVVPTWNYVVVHAHGIPRVMEDRDWLLQHVAELTEVHEREQPQPWKISDAPSDFIDKLVGAIVGIEMPIAKLTGKWKLGQHRSEADKLGTIAGLDATGDVGAQGLARLLEAHIQAQGAPAQAKKE